MKINLFVMLASLYSGFCFADTSTGLKIESAQEASVTAKPLDMQLSIALPRAELSQRTKQLEIPYSYALYSNLNSVNTDNEQTAEIRITFNLLNSNCYAYKIIKAKYQQPTKGAVITQKCQLDNPGTYMGYATICLKSQLAAKGANEICRTVAGNLQVN